MTVEAIIERILAESRRRAAGIEEEANDEAAALRRQAEKEGRRTHARACEEARREGMVIAGRILSVARMDARTAVNEARSAAIRDCIRRAEAQFPALAASPEYPAILGRLIAEGLRDLGGEEAVIAGREEDLPLIREVAREAAAVTAPDGEVPTGGAVLRSKGGDRRVNQTFEGRLQRMQRSVVMEVAARLFSEEEP
ncbi:hypothetical protein FGU65_02490 [Methanoculleus sp. FWC-SCC1]|uniref:V-ATPase subunit E n=1 Tax=Methanoculleus frigidifontis TaxID=2584085 RepID=A0ABT8M765_9EURY|nr:V-type ATP synthase subunit E family protein [Methanoculleus sp. FWC-SCC1]MDN7023774.1 hypothetical protein [Methanoculleus sp. FWC-SCC1]